MSHARENTIGGCCCCVACAVLCCFLRGRFSSISPPELRLRHRDTYIHTYQMAGRAFMKFRRKSKHPDSPCPPELFPNIDLTTLCQVWHLVGVHSTPYFVVLLQDGGVDEADEALFNAHCTCRLPCSLHFGYRFCRQARASVHEGNTVIQKHRKKEIQKKGGDRNPYTPLGTSSCILPY